MKRNREEMDFEEARKRAIELLQPFKPDHPRIKVWVGFEVEPEYWADCSHYETPEEALKQALMEDEICDKERSLMKKGNIVPRRGNEIK